MSECTCHKNYTEDVLIPQVGVITDIRQETPDVKTFRVNAPEGGKLFEHMPGQCAMLCVPGVSEGMFSITSSPTNKEYQEFSIKKCGSLTETLHSLEVGDEITVRGPYGNHFPVEDQLKGKNLLFIAVILALAAVLWLAAHHGGTGRTAVLRYGDPQGEQRIDLRKNAEYDIDTGLYTIHLRVENGGIAFVDSPCPDHLCEGFGTLKNEGDWAACMPAKASVTIE